jgi:hypothetical protein
MPRPAPPRPTPPRPAPPPPPAGSEPLLLELMLGSAHRTLDPEEADFFFVPALTTCWFHPIAGGSSLGEEGRRRAGDSQQLRGDPPQLRSGIYA